MHYRFSTAVSLNDSLFCGPEICKMYCQKGCENLAKFAACSHEVTDGFHLHENGKGSPCVERYFDGGHFLCGRKAAAAHWHNVPLVEICTFYVMLFLLRCTYRICGFCFHSYFLKILPK